LIDNFKKMGLFLDADECYYQFQVDQLYNDIIDSRMILKNPIMYFLRFLSLIFFGFGKKLLYPLIWSAIIIVTFTFFWITVGDFKKFLSERREGNKRKNVFSSGNEYLLDIWPNDIKEALCYSITVFLSGTRLFIDPPPLPIIPGVSPSMVSMAFILERIFGAIFSVLFFFALGGAVLR
jgi:hypothetical protein